MNKPLVGSLVAASLLLGNASAATMYERFEVMEKEMERLQQELNTLKGGKTASAKASARADEEESEDDEDDEDENEEASSDDEGEEEEDDEEFNAQEEIEDLQESVTELNKATAGNHLKLDVDFRTSFDNIHYKMADGVEQKNDAILTNRLWLNMNWAATKNMSFTGQLAYNKTYGHRFGINNNPATGGAGGFEGFDWIANENPSDDTVRVRSAYWFYRNDTFLGTNIPWTFSLGRRPSTNGHLINFRDNDQAASPSGHTINVEFDGLSSRFGLERVTDVPGMYVKLCAGQGATNAREKFAAAPYANNADDLNDIQLAGLIFVPYDNGQFSLGTQFYTATNLIDMQTDGSGVPTGLMETVGNINSASAYMMLNGIGNDWANFLDDTTFFVSGAMSQTDPNESAGGMLGSTDKENGYSYWAGLNMPSLISDEGRFGLEFNHGSKHWRPITYGEDTMIGSKVAARGNAYEAYFTEPLLDDVFSLQVRYTYIDYDYTGSNGFFGNATGAPMKISDIPVDNPMAGMVVDKAQDIRVYLRYRY